jgi:hypothetical protein
MFLFPDRKKKVNKQLLQMRVMDFFLGEMTFYQISNDYVIHFPFPLSPFSP